MELLASTSVKIEDIVVEGTCHDRCKALDKYLTCLSSFPRTIRANQTPNTPPNGDRRHQSNYGSATIRKNAIRINCASTTLEGSPRTLKDVRQIEEIIIMEVI